jgi:hypothetical protein
LSSDDIDRSAKVFEIFLKTASELINFASGIRNELPHLNMSWPILDKDINELFAVAPILIEADRKITIELQAKFIEIRSEIRSSIESMHTLGQTTLALTGFQVSEVSGAAIQAEKAIDELLVELIIGEAYCLRIINVIDKHLQD